VLATGPVSRSALMGGCNGKLDEWCCHFLATSAAAADHSWQSRASAKRQ